MTFEKAVNPLGKNGKEVWKWIPGFNYKISNLGRIRSFQKSKYGDYIGVAITRDGYCKAQLCKDGAKKFITIHRLVARAFLNPTGSSWWVNHKDCNKLNNIITNLELSDRLHNAAHAKAMGRYISVTGENHWTHKFPEKIKYGSKNKRAKLTESTVLELRVLRSKGYSFGKLGKIFNISKVAARYAAIGKTWSHI